MARRFHVLSGNSDRRFIPGELGRCAVLASACVSCSIRDVSAFPIGTSGPRVQLVCRSFSTGPLLRGGRETVAGQFERSNSIDHLHLVRSVEVLAVTPGRGGWIENSQPVAPRNRRPRPVVEHHELDDDTRSSRAGVVGGGRLPCSLTSTWLQLSQRLD
jgi:hypothetical protein